MARQGSIVAILCAASVQANENLPQKPFAQAVQLPDRGELIVTPWYTYSEFFHAWRGGKRESIERNPGSDSHGYDMNDGIVSLDYGFANNWALDFASGYTSAATRSFNATGVPDATEGLLDTAFGLRYQAHHETNSPGSWYPTTTFRAGGIYRGTYESTFPFAPGSGSVGIEPSVLLSKSLGWEGFGAYADLGFRWMRSGGSDQWFAAVGVRQDIGRFTLNLGYRHFANTGGVDIGGTGATIVHSRFVREIKEEIQGGVGYTAAKNGIHYQFYMGKVVDGRNTGSAVTFGLFADLPVTKLLSAH